MRRIRITPEHIAQMKAVALKKIEEQYTGARIGAKGTVDLKFNLDDIELESPIIVNFTGLAFAKQSELIRSCSSEIAWHGLVQTNETRTLFNIHDILVYPQTVSGATVNTNEVEYEQWKAKLNDEQFNTMRFQAHSHVNMAPNPSAVDRNLYDKVLQNIGGSSYYIFMIINKSHNYHVEIYDMKNNAFYDNGDIVITVDGIDIEEWYNTVYGDNIKKPLAPVYTNTWGKTPAPVNPPANAHGNYYDQYFEDDYLTRYARTFRDDPTPKQTKKGGKK